MWREEQLSERTGNLSGGLAVLAWQILLRLPLQVCFQLVASCRWEPREGTKHSEKRNKKTFNLLFLPASPGWQQWCYENLCVYFLRTKTCLPKRRLERGNVFSLLLHIHVSESSGSIDYFCIFWVYVACLCSMQRGNSIVCQEGEWAGHAAEA